MHAADEYRAFINTLMKGARRKSRSTRINNDTEADWCLRRMEELESSIIARVEFVQLEIARLQSWLAHRNKAETNKIKTLHRLLLAYAASLSESGRLREGESFALPHGTITLAPPEHCLIRDEPTLIAWAKERRPDVLETRTSLLWNKLASDLQISGTDIIDRKTGNCVDGVRVRSLSPHFVIKASSLY